MVSLRFRGKYDHAIDDKGRLSFPSRYREVVRQHESEILIAIPWDNHLRIYPLNEWELLENKLTTEDGAYPEYFDKVLRYLESEIYEFTMDKQGRILLPPALRTDLGLKRDIVLIGMIDRVEIWGKEEWNVERQAGHEQFLEHKATIKKKGLI